MAGTQICPSAAALINAKVPPETQANVAALAKAHSDFIHFCNTFPASRERALAATSAEQAFAWALKGIADAVLIEEG